MIRGLLARFDHIEHRKRFAAMFTEAARDGCRTPSSVYVHIRQAAEKRLARTPLPEPLADALRLLLTLLGSPEAWDLATEAIRREALAPEDRAKERSAVLARRETQRHLALAGLPPTSEQLEELQHLHYCGNPPATFLAAETKIRKARKHREGLRQRKGAVSS